MLIDDILELARIPAPTFDEAARIDWLERRLERAPGRRERDAVGNLTVDVGNRASAPARHGARRHGLLG